MNKEWIKITISIVALVLVGIIAFSIMIYAVNKRADKATGTTDVPETETNVISETNDKTDETEKSTEKVVVKTSDTSNDTGVLTEQGNGYEGIKGTGNYNYGEALQKSLLFYELQRSGDLPEKTRCNWRGDSCLNDGADNGVDLSGGWYDAGDNVKFNLPMAYSAAVLGWSIIEDRKSYEDSKQLAYALNNIKWANDYFVKCHSEKGKYYYQVGNGGSDHSWWGPCEVIEFKMERPSYYVSKDNPGSTVTAEAAASLAIASICFEGEEQGDVYLKHAKELFEMSEEWKSDSGYTMAAGFYDSWSGFYDELTWAAMWLYYATEDKSYLDKAIEYYPLSNQDYNWSMCWDDVHIGAAVLLAKETKGTLYTDAVEKHLNYWTTGVDGERITYTPKGLAWLDSWGSLRYATTTGYVAAIYSRLDVCPSAAKETYWNFAVSQADYVLGSTGFSYQIGFGEAYPQNPHHRTAQGSYCDNMNEPSVPRHTLYGALVGGPDSADNYTDEVSNYTTNEVACDYNAGFTGLLAALYSEYHGETLIDFGACEPIDIDELYVEAAVNVDGDDFVEIKAIVYNESAYPARAPKNLELRYYVDLSEIKEAGGDPADIQISSNYSQTQVAPTLYSYDEEKGIYYISIKYNDGDIYPGGQSCYKNEIQFRMISPNGVWNNENDPSYKNLTTGQVAKADYICLYEEGKLIFGIEPGSVAKNIKEVSKEAGTNGKNTGAKETTSENNNGNKTDKNSQNKVSSTDNDMCSVSFEKSGDLSSSVAGNFNITSKTDSLDISKIKVIYYYTNDGNSQYVFDSYHSAINTENGGYTQVDATGSIEEDKCVVSWSSADKLSKGDTVTVNFALHPADWSKIDSSNDYSAQGIDCVVITYDGKVISGKEP